MTSASAHENPAHWREFPVRAGGEIAYAVFFTGRSLALGLAGGAIIFLIAHLLGDLGFLTVGLNADTVQRSGRSLEYLSRASMMPLALLGYLAWVVLAVAWSIKDISISRAIKAAVDGEADLAILPHPDQVASVIKRHFLALNIVLWVSAGFTTLVCVIVAGYAIAEPSITGIAVASGGFAYVLMMIGAYVSSRRAAKAHRGRGSAIKGHWMAQEEHWLWKQARAAAASSATSAHATGPDPRVRTGNRLIGGAITTGALLQSLFAVYAMVRFPGSIAVGSTWQLGDQATFTPGVENLLDLLAGLLIGATILTLGCAVVGQQLRSAGRSGDLRALRGALDNPDSLRPNEAMVYPHRARRATGPAQVLGVLAGVGLMWGSTVMFLAQITDRPFEGAAALFSGFQGPGIIATIAAVLMASASAVLNLRAGRGGLALRNELMQRWPTLPRPRVRNRADLPKALRGPTLTVTVE